MSPSPTPMTAEQLVAIAKNYFRGDRDYDNSDERSPEDQRLWSLWEQKLLNVGRWHALLDDLERALPGFTLGDGTAPSTFSASFRCVVYPAQGSPLPNVRFVTVGCVSILAPVYSVYAIEFEYAGRQRTKAQVHFEPLPPAVAETARIVSEKIEAEFGVQQLPREVADTPVPLIVDWKEPPHTTLFHTLFTSEPQSVP